MTRRSQAKKTTSRKRYSEEFKAPTHLKVVAHPILGGLLHEYHLVAKAAKVIAEDNGQFIPRLSSSTSREEGESSHTRAAALG